MANKIEIISASLVPMATNANPISKLDPTPWDLLFLLLQPIQNGILFHKPESQELQISLINHLKNSLSRTLDFFPPLAGRFSTVKNDDNTTSYFIDCNNAGVEFTHAVAGDVSISDILEPKYIPEIVPSLFPLNGVRNYEGVSKPLLGVQITELVDGLFIACTMNHAVADGTSFWHFFNSWSEISRGLDKISKPPVFERWFPDNVPKDNPLIPLPPLELNWLQNIVPPPLLERVFHFSKESVAKLKAKANSEAGTTKISSLQALSAHLWRSVTRCRYEKSTDNLCGQEVNFVLIVGTVGSSPSSWAYVGLGPSPVGHLLQELNRQQQQQRIDSLQKRKNERGQQQKQKKKNVRQFSFQLCAVFINSADRGPFVVRFC
ncbi:Shikimate O-hydroxycinnamoyltransferase [Handroanthus impetiginosus]|uniref:Shikimate O-hydroxycinnamoyltransferase n=1 Tax=Handroanthus impetiginosus TaxID=429701 RepID=A0A2G9G675_9LAMI|nr:Shikimate O-hydroxycinnamoyltransferase [Handroanthus impetiginosus]